MYSKTTSSVTFPDVATKYPRAQMCRPQNGLFRCRNSIINFLDDFPFTYCMILLADMFGGADTKI